MVLHERTRCCFCFFESRCCRHRVETEKNESKMIIVDKNAGKQLLMTS